MKINDVNHWDGFVYSLIYPGFVGSMVYELIPQDDKPINSMEFGIKALITLLYCLDYLHLYTDMETVAKDKKDTAYVLTDIATSAALFGSFVLIKLKILMPVATIVISLVPWIILQYKKRNKFDKPVFERFGLLLISLTTIYLIIHNLLKKLIWLSNEVFLISMLSIMIISYSYYIFKFYNENSKDEDERIFGQIKKVEKS